MSKFLIALIAWTLTGCASIETPPDHLPNASLQSPATNADCDRRSQLPSRDAIGALNRFSELVATGCHTEALALGEWIRKTYRDKSYSLVSETLSVFVPEDALSEYVLESYERAYLSFLMAQSYLDLGKKDEASVELRRSYSEGKAILYNYGEDPVNALLLAALWENLGDANLARPFWAKAASLLPNGDPAKEFAEDRIAQLDGGGRAKNWRILSIGRFPELKWKLDFNKNRGNSSGFYEVESEKPFPPSCRSSASVAVSTASWMKKIEARYSYHYHPLLNAKSWIRFPIGIAYGLTTFTAGMGVLVTGCLADAYANGRGDLCHAAAETGGALMSKTGDVIDFALKPDLRHWQRVPAAVLIQSVDENGFDDCEARLNK